MNPAVAQEYSLVYANKRPQQNLLVHPRPTHLLIPPAHLDQTPTSAPIMDQSRPHPSFSSLLYSPPPDVSLPTGLMYVSRMANGVNATETGDSNLRDVNYYTTTTMLVNNSHRKLSSNKVTPVTEGVQYNANGPGGNATGFFNAVNPRKDPNMNFKEKITRWLDSLPFQQSQEASAANNEAGADYGTLHHSPDVYNDWAATYYSPSPTISGSEIDFSDTHDIVEFQAKKITRYVTRLYAFDNEPVVNYEEEEEDEAGYGIDGSAYEEESYQVMLHPRYP